MLKLLKHLFTPSTPKQSQALLTKKEEKVNQDVCKLFDEFQALDVVATQYPRNTMPFHHVIEWLFYEGHLGMGGFSTEDVLCLFDKHKFRRPSQKTLYHTLREFGYRKTNANKLGFDGKWYCVDLRFEAQYDEGNGTTHWIVKEYDGEEILFRIGYAPDYQI